MISTLDTSICCISSSAKIAQKSHHNNKAARTTAATRAQGFRFIHLLFKGLIWIFEQLERTFVRTSLPESPCHRTIKRTTTQGMETKNNSKNLSFCQEVTIFVPQLSEDNL